MRRAARAIVIKDDHLLVIHRNKFGNEYDILPGGSIFIGETPEQAVLRELQEETGIQTSGHRLVFLEHAGDMYGDQWIFLCDYVSGEPVLSPTSDEAAINKLGKNLYEPLWRPLREMAQLPFRSVELRKRILHGVEFGWPDSPVEFESVIY